MQNITIFSNDLCDTPDFGTTVVVYDRVPSRAAIRNDNTIVAWRNRRDGHFPASIKIRQSFFLKQPAAQHPD
jgi:hypothetical protein